MARPTSDTERRFPSMGASTDGTRHTGIEYERVMENIALEVGLWTWHPMEDRVVWHNGVRALLQLPDEHPASWELWLKQVHPADQDYVRASVQRPSDNCTEVYSYRIVRKDGSVVPIEDRRSTDEDGVCHGVFISATAPWQTARNPPDIATLLQQTLDAIGVGILIRDFKNNLDYWNGSLRQLLSVSRQGIKTIDERTFTQHAPEEVETVRRLEDKLYCLVTPVEAVYPITTSDGTRRWVRERGRHHPSGSGPDSYYVAVIEDITAEKTLAEAASEARDFLVLTLQANRTAVWEWNQKTDTHYWSDDLYAILGLQPDIVKASPEAWFDAMHPDDRGWVNEIANTKGLCEVNALTYRIIVSGATRWIRESWKDITTDDGTAVGAVIRRGITSDITDLKEKENSHYIINNWLRLAVDAGQIGLWSHSGTNDVYLWNDNIYQLLGYRNGEVTPSQSAWNAKIHPEDIEAVKAQVDLARAEREREFVLRYRAIMPDRKVRWLEEHGTTTDKQGNRYGVLLDITEQMMTQNELEKSRQRLQLALDTGQMGFWTGHGEDEDWDERTYRLLGYEPYSVKPSLQTFLQAIHPDDQRTIIASDEVGRRTGETLTNEYRLAAAFKNVRWIESTRTFASQHSPERYGVIRDITERKEQEELQVRSERLNAAGQMLSSLAHDFNNFLAIISGLLEPLSESSPDPDAKQRISQARHAVELATLFNRRLISMSHQRTWLPEIIEIPPLVDDICAVIRPILRKSITLSTQFPSGLWLIDVDRLEFESAIINIILNARDAIALEGNIEVSVSRHAACPDEHDTNGASSEYIKISIRDTGRGMDADTLTRSTEPFFSTKLGGLGTGLGLSSVAEFARSASGYLSINSTPEVGTTVSLHIPRAHAGEDRSVQQPHVLSSPTGNGELVLIVDDDDWQREILMQRVEALGYSVEEAADVPSALSTLHSIQAISVVLSDVNMPGPMNGMDLLRTLNDMTPETPVILLTGHQDRPPVPPNTVLLAKSCTRLELAHALATALNDRHKHNIL